LNADLLNMSNDARAQARQRLASLIERALADGVIDDQERESLQALYREAVLTVTDVKGVLSQYLRALEDDVLADGRVTPEERARCQKVVSQLRIPPGLLSPQIRAILGMPG
jgi:uncharacterized membrane protein YebE (DUF533 family)